MKKIWFALALLIVIIGVGNHSQAVVNGGETNDNSPNRLCFASSGAISLESRLDAWAKIDSTFRSEIADFDLINTSLNLPGTPIWRTVKLPGSMERNTTIGKEHFIIARKTVDSKTAFELVTIISSDDRTDLNKYARLLADQEKIKWHFNYTYCGEFEKSMNRQDMKNLTRKMIKSISVSILEEFDGEADYSVQGWSPRVNFGISPVCGAANVQIAVRREESQGKTKAWVGMPLIMSDY